MHLLLCNLQNTIQEPAAKYLATPHQQIISPRGAAESTAGSNSSSILRAAAELSYVRKQPYKWPQKNAWFRYSLFELIWQAKTNTAEHPIPQ